MKIKYLLGFVVSAFLVSAILNSCTSSGGTEITGVWNKPGHSESGYKNILVIGLAKDANNRIVLENAFAKELKNMDATAKPSWLIIPSDSIDINKDSTIDDQEKTLFKERIINKGFDGAIVLSLRDVKTKDYYVPGNVIFTPPPYYGYFYGYYFGMYSTVIYPGYTVKEYDLYMESNFYDLKKEELIWSAQSKSINPGSIEDFCRSYSRTIVEGLLKDKVIK